MALGKRVIDMYEAAFGAFNVVKSERIRHPTELKAVWVVERSRVERYDSIPTALHRYRVTRYHGAAGNLGSEVRKCRCHGFVAIGVA